jgi:hypothetical protein
MGLFDTLLAARGALAQWVVAHPFDAKNPNSAANAQRSDVMDAEEELSQALLTVENMNLDNAMNAMQADAQALSAAAKRISGIASSLDEVTNVLNDIDAIVGILGKIPGVGGG